ncbi:uncharacterized protein V1518DRAFT_409010 [Limtongia smithiae]|uniref:uncharacterized protein n=1 Tax=Limtongia smithiae TaxID=1125753 RepID=UPI0034CE44CB
MNLGNTHHTSMEDIFSKPVLSAPVLASQPASYLEPAKVVLPDGRKATIYAFFRTNDEKDIEVSLPGGKNKILPAEDVDRLIAVLWKLLNREIEGGRTYPQWDTLSFIDFRNYWFILFTAVIILDESSGELDLTFKNAEELALGTFYVKPNYPGRCGHVCNAGFLVSDKFRGQKIGKTLGAQYVKWAPQLGYTSSIFNLVFETNIASQKIWDGLGFEKVGRVKKAAWVKGLEERGPVDAIIYSYDFTKDQ